MACKVLLTFPALVHFMAGQYEVWLQAERAVTAAAPDISAGCHEYIYYYPESCMHTKA